MLVCNSEGYALQCISLQLLIFYILLLSCVNSYDLRPILFFTDVVFQERLHKLAHGTEEAFQFFRRERSEAHIQPGFIITGRQVQTLKQTTVDVKRFLYSSDTLFIKRIDYTNVVIVIGSAKTCQISPFSEIDLKNIFWKKN